ncbi:armadillo-type protein [Catenaria anguillulae PL171]|uniref:Armadillo-type protein n=1 Tax=Catenaria anguillulae PL171 TaxID=765915 RepID=A0A1Y2HDZ0_9FUNG|nr:armadillo-type protein [Catenaria anguillulae PL171]
MAALAPPSFSFDPDVRLRAESSQERQELAAFQWLSKLCSDLDTAPSDVIKANQPNLERRLGLFLSFQNAPIKPSRAIRRLIAGCYLGILSRGDSRRAFDVLVSVQSNLGASIKATKENEHLITAVRMLNIHILGRLTERFGANYYSVLGETTHLMFKVLKSTSTDSVLRNETLDALSRAFRGAGKGLNDAQVKDALKLLKQGLTEKSMAVRQLSAECISGLARQANLGLQTAPDFDSFLHPLVRAFEGSNYDARIAIARAIANILAPSQQSFVVPISPAKLPQKKSGTKPDRAPLLKYHARESRIGIAEAYVMLFQLLGASYVESNYPTIVAHFVNDILSSPRYLTLPQPEVVSIKEIVIHILRSIGQLQSETAQINAIKHILDIYGGRWPALPQTPVPNKWSLHALLAEIAGLLNDVNGVAATLPESSMSTLLKLAGHPSHLVQSSAALCVLRLGINSPATFGPMFSHLHAVLYKEMANISMATPTENLRKYIGYSLSVSALLAAAPKVPFGSNGVKAQLSQLLLLWKDAFPKAQSSGGQGDIVDLLHGKEVALKALCALLLHNGDILTPDLRKRLAVLVTNVIQLVLAHPTLATPGLGPMPPTTKLSPLTLSYGELECMFRKRLMDTVSLLPAAQFDSYHGQLVKAASDLFAQDPADARRFDPGQQYQVYHAFDKQLQPVNSPVGPLFWQSAEYASHTLRLHGISDVSGRHLPVRDPGFVQPLDPIFDFEKWDTLEKHVQHPVAGGSEFDSLALLQAAHNRPTPSPPAFALVNSAIGMFGLLFPHLPPSSQEAYLDTYARYLKQKQERPGKRIAMLVNVIQAMNTATAVMVQLNAVSHSKKHILTPQATKSLLEIAHAGNCSSDGGVRLSSASIIGRVAELAAGNTASATIAQFLVSQIVDNRDPDVRAGAAMALVMLHVYTQSSSIIKTTVGVLHTLCTDLHPGVAGWATYALAHLMEARAAQVYPLVTPTLSVVCRQLMLEARPQFVGRVLFGCIDALGPELQVSDKIRELLTQFTEYLLEWDGLEECAEAWRAATHLLLMAPGTFPVPRYAGVLQALLGADHITLRRSVLQCLCSMVQRGPELVLENTTDLERTLVMLARAEPDLVNKSLASLIESSINPFRWIELCRSLLSPSSGGTAVGSPSAPEAGAGSGTDTDDDGDEVAVASVKPAERKQVHIQWTSQFLALQTLRQLIRFLATGPNREYHVNLALARGTRGDWLVSRLGELIRVAFTASTALSHTVRREGLALLEDVLDHFSVTEDPDFPGHRLLEQYQAQFSSALTPAFTAEADPEIVATASHVCARYIGSGITDDLLTLSRIIRLLTQALSMVQNASSGTSISGGAAVGGSTAGQSQHAQIMIALAVLGAWADIRRAAAGKPALAEVVGLQLTTLLPLWLSVLFEYAVVKQDMEVLGMLPSKVESMSANLSYALSSRDVVLPLQTLETDSLLTKHGSITTPYGEFQKLQLVIFGLAFEPLVSVRSSEDTTIVCLEALQVLLSSQNLMKQVHPSIAKEILTMCDRLMQTEAPKIQGRVLSLASTLMSNESLTTSALAPGAGKLISILKHALDNPSSEEERNSNSRLAVSLAATLISHAESNLQIDPSIFNSEVLADIRVRLAGLIVQAVQVPELSIVTLQCARSLFQLAKRSEQRTFAEACARVLLPHFIVIVFTDPVQVTPSAFSECVATIALAGAMCSGSEGNDRDKSMAMLVSSVLIGVLVRFPPTHSWAPVLRPVAVQGIMAMAKVCPQAFRDVVSQMPQDSRTALEAALRGPEDKSVEV